MKNLLFILCIFLLSGCSLFKASNKKKFQSDSLSETSSTKTLSEIDTSQKNSTRKWKLTFSPVPQADNNLKSYHPPVIFPDLGTGDLKNAMQNLQKSYNQLAGKKMPDTNEFFNHGYQLATLEMEETVNEQLAKFKAESEKDTSNHKASTNLNETDKQPINSWLVLGCVALGFFALIIMMKR